MAKVIVCGGRAYQNRARVYTELDRIHADINIELVAHGAAKGADTLAMEWAREHRIPEWPFPANWEQDGRNAGPIRNRRMLALTRPEVVIAFPGGKGTADMVRRAGSAGVRVIRIPVEPNQ